MANKIGTHASYVDEKLWFGRLFVSDFNLPKNAKFLSKDCRRLKATRKTGRKRYHL